MSITNYKIIFVTILAIGIYGFNNINLQSKINDVIKSDQRNQGIVVSVYSKVQNNKLILIYDLQKLSGENSMADVFRVFLQFSEKVKSENFDLIELSFRGKTKFKISGYYFKKLGNEYSFQNPVYTARIFPENLLLPNGSRAYTEWKGGLLGVAKKQIEDCNDFHKKWYLDELLNE